MAQRLVVFDGDSLLKLLVHYTNAGDGKWGRVPLDGEVKALGFNVYLPHWVQLLVESGQWDEKINPLTGRIDPLHIRYEGKKVLRWGDSHIEAKEGWGEAPERPTN